MGADADVPLLVKGVADGVAVGVLDAGSAPANSSLGSMLRTKVIIIASATNKDANKTSLLIYRIFAPNFGLEPESG